jgi:DNA polymerase IV
VAPGRRRRSIGTQRALGRAPRSWGDLDTTLVALVDRLARRLRRARRVCRTVVLRLRFDDLARATRSHTMTEATAQTAALLAAERGLLAASVSLIERRGITLLGIAFTNLEDVGARQLELPLDFGRSSALDAALDDVRERFGAGAITRAVLLGRDQGLTIPLLPD